MAKDFKVEHYHFSVCWSEEDEAYLARVAEFRSLSAHGDSMEEALQELQSLMRFVIDDLKASGEYIPEPLSQRDYSGRFNVRTPKDLHRKLSMKAAQEQVSLNQYIVNKLSEAVG